MLRTQIDSQCTQPVSSGISATAALHQTWTDSLIFHGKLWGEKHCQLQHLCWRNQWLLHVWREATLPVSPWRNSSWVTTSQAPFFLDKAYITLMKPPLLKGAYWGLVEIDWSAWIFSCFSSGFSHTSRSHTPWAMQVSEVMRYPALPLEPPVDVKCRWGTVIFIANLKEETSKNGLKSWPKNGSFKHLVFFVGKNWCCCMLL